MERSICVLASKIDPYKSIIQIYGETTRDLSCETLSLAQFQSRKLLIGQNSVFIL